jgi:hypothetical protein
MNTKANQLVKPEGDMDLVINAEAEKKGGLRKVKGYTQVGDNLIASVLAAINFDTNAEFNSGTYDGTIAVDDKLQVSGGIIDQSLSDDSYKVYGANWAAQSFVATGTSINKIALLYGKVLGTELTIWDDFSDGIIDTNKWLIEGASSVTEVGGEFIIFSSAPSYGRISTTGKTDGDDWEGCKFSIRRASGDMIGVSNDSCYAGIFSGSDYIRLSVHWGNCYLNSSSNYGGLNINIGGYSHTCEIKPYNGNLEIYIDGVLNSTVTDKTISGYFKYYNASPNGDTDIRVSNVYKYSSVTAMTDTDIRIESDTAGKPSGSALANGTSTILDTDVSTSPGWLEATFATPPATVEGTTYWLLSKQTGGGLSNYYRLYKKNSDEYLSGNFYVSSDGGTTWAVDPDGSTDAAFKVYANYATSGTWISSNITLTTGQTMTQLNIKATGLSSGSYISQVDIVNTSNAVQSSYTTDIISGTSITLRNTDLSFSFTNGNTFRIKLTLVSNGTTSPMISSVSIDFTEKIVKLLAPFYQSSGTKALIAGVAGTIKRLINNQWIDVDTNLTSGLDMGAVISRASKHTIVKTGTATAGASTSLTDSAYVPAPNIHQGQMIKIVRGTGAGQVRVIKNSTGTTTSTTTSTSSTTSTTRSTSTTQSTSTSTTTTA